MTLVLGVDGCPGGWCCVAIDADTTEIASAEVHPTFERVLQSPATLICVDIPIGLLDVPGQRACDVEARRLLGRGRASSVFPPPSRRSLSFAEYREASDVNFQITERRLSKQSFNISPKVREVDGLMKPAFRSACARSTRSCVSGRSTAPWRCHTTRRLSRAAKSAGACYASCH